MHDENLSQVQQIARYLKSMTEAERGRQDVLLGDIHGNTGPRRTAANQQLEAFIAQHLSDGNANATAR